MSPLVNSTIDNLEELSKMLYPIEVSVEGMTTDSNASESTNILFPRIESPLVNKRRVSANDKINEESEIELNVDGIDRSRIEVKRNIEFPKIVSPFIKMTKESDVHPSNALSPIVTMVDGIVASVKLKQPAYACSIIVVFPSGMERAPMGQKTKQLMILMLNKRTITT